MIEQRKYFAHFLLNCSSQQFKYVLKTLTKDQLQIIIEIILNVTKGICPISDNDKTVLMKKKSLIRDVLLSRLTLTQRRQRLQKFKKLLPIFLKACVQYGA